ncbi:MAG: hypothetical protein RLZZ127_1283 [Planctomycetota bacterium]|jgi:hypothetical protein
MPPIRSRPGLLLLVLVPVVATDQAALGSPPGAGLAVALTALTGCMAVRFPPVGHGAWTALALAGAGIAAVLLDGGILGALIALLATAGLATAGRGHRGIAGPLLAWAWALLRVPARILADLRLCRGWGRGLRAAAGWLAPLAVAAVFLACFIIANPVIADWTAEGMTLLLGIGLPSPLRIMAAAATVAVAATCLRQRWRVRGAPAPATPRSGDAAGVVRCLLAACAVFAVHLSVDGWVLLTGHGQAGGWGAYAQRGAYPLVATALLAAGFMLWWFRPGHPAGRDPVARRLLILWVAMNGLLLAGAGWRLGCYIDALGLTAWRLATALWMAVVLAGLVLVAVRIASARGNRWLVDANALVVAIALLLWSGSDIDRLIAMDHARRAAQGAAVDLEYLAGLGDTARPELERMAEQARDPAVQRGLRGITAVMGSGPVRWRDWTVWDWSAARSRSTGP